jgi:hypothetical protein
VGGYAVRFLSCSEGIVTRFQAGQPDAREPMPGHGVAHLGSQLVKGINRTMVSRGGEPYIAARYVTFR